MDSVFCFIQQTFQFLISLFFDAHSLKLGPWNPSIILTCPQHYIGLIFYYTYYSSGISHFSKGSCSLLLENGIQKPTLGTKCAHLLRGTLLLGPFKGQLENMCTELFPFFHRLQQNRFIYLIFILLLHLFSSEYYEAEDGSLYSKITSQVFVAEVNL